jgi:plastocyanin
MRRSPALLVLLLAACSSGSPSPSALVSETPSSEPSVAPTLAATSPAPVVTQARVTASPTPAPTRSPTPSPSASPAARPRLTHAPSPTPAPKPTRTQAHVGKTYGVTIQTFMFMPRTLTIRVGDSIRVTNKDGASHTFTADNGSFDSGNLDQGQAKTLTFRTRGTFDFMCSYHPSMTGTLTVNP